MPLGDAECRCLGRQLGRQRTLPLGTAPNRAKGDRGRAWPRYGRSAAEDAGWPGIRQRCGTGPSFDPRWRHASVGAVLGLWPLKRIDYPVSRRICPVTAAMGNHGQNARNDPYQVSRCEQRAETEADRRYAEKQDQTGDHQGQPRSAIRGRDHGCTHSEQHPRPDRQNDEQQPFSRDVGQPVAGATHTSSAAVTGRGRVARSEEEEQHGGTTQTHCCVGGPRCSAPHDLIVAACRRGATATLMLGLRRGGPVFSVTNTRQSDMPTLWPTPERGLTCFR